MARKSIADSLSILKEQKVEYQSFINSSPLKDHLKSIKMGLRFLESVFDISDDESFNLQIEGVVNNVLVELRLLSNRPKDGNLLLDLDRGYTSLREMMKNDIINPETREYSVVYVTLFRKVRYLSDFNDFVTGGISILSRYKADLISPLVKEKLWFLEALLTYIANLKNHITGGEEIRDTLADLLTKSACLVYPCLVGKMDEEMELVTNHNLSALLEKNKVKEIYIAFYRTSKIWYEPGNLLGNEIYHLDSLINILESNVSFVVHLNDSSMKLHDKLKFLKHFLADLPQEVIVEKFTYLVTSMEAIMSGAVPIIYSYYDEDMKEEVSSEAKGLVLQLRDQIEEIQVAVSEMKLYNYPKTNELGFLDLFLEHLEELLNSRTEFVEILKNEIEELRVAFDSLRSFLKKMRKLRYEHEELEDLWTRIIGLAYQAEYIIDFFLVKKASDSRIMFSISNVIKQTKLIMSEVEGIDVEKYHTQAHGGPKSSDQLPSQTTETTTENVLVGFEDEAEKIRGYLLGDSKKRDVISIVGMPGLGKTTLAKKMYEDPFLVEHFHFRAWCTVSQTYEKENLLLSILGSVVIHPDEMKKLEGLDSDEKLNKILMGHRYFIILDDIWDIGVWTDLVRSLPDNNNSSRVLITSRLHNVASQVKAGIVHPLRPFSDHESWVLFQKKLLEKESFSQEFMDVGKEIAMSCNGLPLAIVVATGLLAKLEKNIHMWETIARNLSSRIVSDSETQCMAILELSYKELPDHLKSCFLYFGAFPEDAEITVRKLKWLWISEGFVRNSGETSLEDTAEEYFMNLKSRSLVTTTRESSTRGAKTCGVHDILRDFCLEKAKSESFLQVVNNDDTSGISVVYDQRRLSFYCDREDLDKAKPSSWSVRSLFNSYPRYEQMTSIHQNFMLLRVLDVGYLDIDESFEGVIFLIHLRYLAFTSRSTSIPSSISNLSNLQYLHIGHPWERRYGMEVADSFWDMANLMNVNIDFNVLFDFESSRFENSNFVHNLETLSTPYFYSQELTENFLRSLPKLRKLKCVFVFSHKLRHSSKGLNLTFLHQLKSLWLKFDPLSELNRARMRCELNLPLNLQKLTLSAYCLSLDEISKIGKSLPNLKVLKLFGDFANEIWNVNEGDFLALEYLKLSEMDIWQWNASENCFPILEQIVLDNCRKLHEIPPCFGESTTLEMVTLNYCNRSCNASVKEIEKQQVEELQNLDFKVNYGKIWLSIQNIGVADSWLMVE